MTWLSLNWPQVLDLLLAHLALSIPAILLSAVIAIPLGRFANTRPRAGGAVLGVATLLYAVPSLPLLIVIPVILGVALRSASTMVIALTVYGVALFVRTSADAFGSVDQGTRDTATAIGYAPRAVFWHVDLPLAAPLLIAGLRVVSVSTIGLVTIGALIGVKNLGTLMTDGFQRGIAGEVAVGVIATVFLALIIDALLLLAGRSLAPWARQARAGRAVSA
ncbi:ABC transporter permease [Glutamicibacter sp. NPDC127525]|uniref:ABC transporter permease n=1 Tax=unclassified Glutamicibacter TaxID=2627139 RepID=UPI0036355369